MHAYLKAQPNRRLPEEECKSIFKQLLTILAYCHNKNVTHRDIKLENVIIDKKGKIKLIDFGFCTCTTPDTKLKIFCGTPSYMCPEIVMKKEYRGTPTDIWASAIFLYATLCGQFPFRGQGDKDLYKKIARGFYTPPDHLSKDCKLFLSRMLIVDPERRGTAAKLLEDPWLKDAKTICGGGSEFLSTNESSNHNV
jgi:serine/threonine protein kinase